MTKERNGTRCSVGELIAKACGKGSSTSNGSSLGCKVTQSNQYCFVNRTIQFWNQLPADALGNLSCKPSNFRKRVRKVINKEKFRGVHRSEVR
jgi:hypothetical protein